MLKWILGNISTIIICAILVLIVALVIWFMIKNKRKGKTSCGCGCSSCAMYNSCHGQRK